MTALQLSDNIEALQLKRQKMISNGNSQSDAYYRVYDELKDKNYLWSNLYPNGVDYGVDSNGVYWETIL